MDERIQYWANKLDKIQFALDMLNQVKKGRDLDRLISHLQEAEELTAKDLIEAELDEERRQDQ